MKRLILGLAVGALLLTTAQAEARWKNPFSRSKAARPLVKGSVGSVHVMGSRVIANTNRRQVSVRLKIYSTPTRDGQQQVTEQTVTLKANREVLLGSGSREGDKVFVRADRLGRITRRYYQQGRGNQRFVAPSSLFGAEIKKVAAGTKTTRLSGYLYAPISGADLNVRGRDARRFTTRGDKLTRDRKDGSTRSLTGVWRSLDGQQYKASRMNFTATVANGKATILDMGRYRNGYNEPTRVKLHVQDGNVQGMSMIIEGK